MYVSIVILTVLAWAARERNKVWQSEETLWLDTAQKSPLKVRPRVQLANAYQSEQRYSDALREFREAEGLSSSQPNFDRTSLRQTIGSDIAITLIQMGQFDKAAQVALPLWNEFPGYPKIGASLAAIALYQRKPQAAIDIIDASLKVVEERRWNTQGTDGGYLLQIKAESFKMLQNCDQALALYRMAATVDPDLAVTAAHTPPTCP